MCLPLIAAAAASAQVLSYIIPLNVAQVEDQLATLGPVARPEFSNDLRVVKRWEPRVWDPSTLKVAVLDVKEGVSLRPCASTGLPTYFPSTCRSARGR